MFTLRFAFDGVYRLAEHAASCSEHAPSYTQLLDGVDQGQPALVWVKDDGIYLMTNGIPGLLHDPADPESNVVVYAEDWESGSRQELGHIDEIGGDDFAVHLELGETLSNGRTLLETIRAAHALGAEWFVLELRGRRLVYRFERAAPDTQP